MQPVLQTRQLTFSYDSEKEFRFKDISLNQGDELLVLGGSGHGKTTFLHLMAGLLKANSGEVLLKGESLAKKKGTELDKYRAQNIGLVFQKPHFIKSISVFDNLRWAMKLAGKSTNEEQIREMAQDLGIEHRLKGKASELSQGELQRASMLRAVVNKPALILADEPTSALDDENCEKVMNLLKELKNEHKAALVVVTHDGRVKESFKNQISL